MATQKSDNAGARAAKTALQVLAILCLAAICLIILHKGYTDVSALARSHAGADFWRALGRYLLRNLGGGGPEHGP